MNFHNLFGYIISSKPFHSHFILICISVFSKHCISLCRELSESIKCINFLSTLTTRYSLNMYSRKMKTNSYIFFGIMTTRTRCTETLLSSDYIFFFHQRNRVFDCLLFGQAALVFSEFIFKRVRPPKIIFC